MSGEIVLPRRAIPQPPVRMVPAGDCGACVLGGILGLSVADTYERFIVSRFKQLQSFCHENVIRALDVAERDGIADRVVIRVPIWPTDSQWMTWGLTASTQWQPWATYLRMALDAGYYGVAPISTDGRGSSSAGPDHWVMLCGWRPSPNGTALEEVLVSCSARHPEGKWYPIREFLHDRGGLNALFARPCT